MNIASLIMKLPGAKKQFGITHPKFMAFVKSILARPMEEGSVVEVTVTRPGEAPVTANLKIQHPDQDLLALLKELVQ